MTDSVYRGRFAPSPTGLLHFGSLIAAVGSYLQAKSQHGEWWLRIEDIDPPREVAGASAAFLRILDILGFEWDHLSYQHNHYQNYADALTELKARGLLYGCACSRKQLAEQYPDSKIYPGICRHGLPAGKSARSLRIRAELDELSFEDCLQGQQHIDFQNEIGDFIVMRADGLYAYQLAVAVDDVLQEISEVVRGCDLLDSTFSQIYLQQQLGYRPPQYLHLPIAADSAGHKLSKSTGAAAVTENNGMIQLWQALQFLGQNPPIALQQSNPDEFWHWAIHNWQAANIPKTHEIKLNDQHLSADTNSNHKA